MKLYLLSVCIFWTAFASAQSTDLAVIAQAMGGMYSSERLPQLYSDRSLMSEEVLFLLSRKKFKAHWQDLEDEALREWGDYVQGEWELWQQGEYTEFDFTDEQSKVEIQNNPHPFIGLPVGAKLNGIEAIYALYKQGEWIGYAIEFINRARSEQIEDGSGVVLYLDVNLDLAATTDWDG